MLSFVHISKMSPKKVKERKKGVKKCSFGIAFSHGKIFHTLIKALLEA